MFINIHSHTNYSDGGNTIREMAEAARVAGHCCFVATDHDYRMTSEKYERQLVDAAFMSAEMKFPIHVGLEISFCGEEANLIGVEACRTWLKKNHYRQDLTKRRYRKDYFLIKEMKDECAVILVHPSGRGGDYIYDVFDGFEIRNCGQDWPEDRLKVLRERMPGKREFIGLDAHSISWFEDRNVNEISFVPETEEQLIRWIKEGE